MPELRFRQVHLDFHTSEHIPGVGSEFDPERFVDTLKRAHVDSITLFSRCHHGWIYHDTKFPNRHPHLTCDLLAEQIRACHAADIRCPIYITVGWDEYAARTHPEWLEIDEEGRRCGPSPSPLKPGWRNLDFASPYVDYVIGQTEEVLERFGDEADGFFFDIIFQKGVHSSWCLAEFERLGLDAANQEHQNRLRDVLVERYCQRVADAVRAKNAKATIFHNGGHVGPAFRRRLPNYSHLEIESLPTGGWGYMHFPITVRYARMLGLDCLGMTGKFSETWGHFNSYKPQAALEYECLSMLAQGSKCSVGDQLHPKGTLDPLTYDLIGSVYSQVKDREPWCRGARSVTEIAVLNAEEFFKANERMDPSNLGACRMLMEGRHQFDFVDSEADLSGYRLLIIPDVIPLEGDLRSRVGAFVARGGAVIFSGRSALDETSFAVDGFPVEWVGELPHSPDFLQPTEALSSHTGSQFVMYERGQRVRNLDGADVLATVYEPYFDRTWDHFCSHAHAPVAGTSGDPAVLQWQKVIYFAHPIFTTYAKHSMPAHRDLVLAAIRRIMPDPLVQVAGPTSLQATVTRQELEGRTIVHLLHYVPERRGLNFEIVEDRLPLHDLTVRVRTDLSRATLQPEGTQLEIVRDGAYAVVKVPRLDGHTMIVFE